MFFEVLSAINNPKQQASIEQLSQVTQSVQQLTSSQGLDNHQMQAMMTALGEALQPALKQQQPQLSDKQLVNLLGQLSDSNQTTALQSLIPPDLQQQLAQTVAQKTNLNATMLQSMLPQLLPVVMGLFNMGAAKSGTAGNENPILAAFLNGNRAGSTDLGDVMKFADRFLNGPN